MSLLPTTELEAVNTMLSIIGEPPINSLQSGLVDAVMARQILHEVLREVQSRGWHWNTDRGRVLPVTYPQKYIYVPQNTLMVDTVGEDSGVDVVQRGNRLYDRQRHTYQFDKSLKCDVTLLLAYDEIPQPARQYVMVRAGRIFQDRVVGSEALNGFNIADEQRAWATLRAHEAETGDYNLGDNPALQRVTVRHV